MGCTTSINSFKKEMLPYIDRQLTSYINGMTLDDIQSLIFKLQRVVNEMNNERIKFDCREALSDTDLKNAIISCITKMVKSRTMKKPPVVITILCDIWGERLVSEVTKGHVYEDFLPLLKWCQGNKTPVSVYSGGSIQFQKSLFRHTLEGDLTSYITSYFDVMNAGLKESSSSYIKIANEMGVDPKEIMFVSDSEDELIAAREAGIGHVVLCVRPGNVAVTSTSRDFPIIHSLLQLCQID
jgi:enolase-phosphatase E1